jgi:hypothetical protein
MVYVIALHNVDVLPVILLHSAVVLGATCKDYPNCCGGLCPVQWLITKQVVCNLLRSFNKSFLEQYIYEKCNKK